MMDDILKRLGIEPVIIDDSELGSVDLTEIETDELDDQIEEITNELGIKLEP